MVKKSRKRRQRGVPRHRRAAQPPGRGRQEAEARPAPAARAVDAGRVHALGALVLLALVVVSYLPAMLWGGFVWDDIASILKEPALRDGAGLARIWFAPTEVSEPHYRPLTYTTFWLEHKLWGYAPNGYHVVNVLLHAGSVLVLWRILARLTVPGAWLIAAVFAVHPLHVESVAWVIERKDALSGLFYLACVLVWLPFLEAPAGGARRRGDLRRYGLALVLFAAGLLAKNMVVTLPAALVVLHWWRRGRVTRGDALRLVPLFLLAFAFIALDMALVTTATPAAFGYSVIERLLIAARAIWFYVGKLAWPADLAVIYPRWEVAVGDVAGWLALAAAVGAAAGLWLLRGRIGRGPLAGALFFAVTLSPTLGFIDHTYMLFAFVADRYQYLAGIGVMAVFIGAAAALVAPLPPRWRLGAHAVSAVVLLLLGALTWRQAAIYRDQATFFTNVIARNPEAVGAHLNLAQALIDENRLIEAVEAGRVAVAQRPDSYDAHINLAVALAGLQRFTEAEQHLRRAVEIAPAESGPHANLAVLLSRRNDYDGAERHLRRALELAPRDLGVLRNLAKLLAMRDQPEEALGLYDRVLARGAGDVATHQARGDILLRLGRHGDALAAWQAALDEGPSPDAAVALHLAMGRAEWVRSSDAGAAAAHYERALAIEPQHAGALGDLASLRIAQQRFADAEALYARAIEGAPDNAAFHAGRGYALYRLGRADAAIASLEQALALDPTLREARDHLALARRQTP